MIQIDAILRDAYHINPKLLSQKEWIQLFNEWVYMQELKAYQLTNIIRKAITPDNE